MVPGSSRSIKLKNKDYIKSTNHFSLPLIGRISAGFPILSEEHIETQYKLDSKLFSLKPDYLLRVKGMSMKDIGILEDDLLIIKKFSENYSTKLNGRIVVARLDYEVTVKKFQKKKNFVYLCPENSAFSPIKIDTNKQLLVIEGLAIGIIRNPKLGL
jgi:repressor LexA